MSEGYVKMKKILLTLLCLFTCIQCFSVNMSIIDAANSDAFNLSKKKPTSGQLYEMDYYMYTERYLNDITVTYDSKKRVFNDGIFYHLYDKAGNEIDYGLPTRYAPCYGMRSDWYKLEVKRDSSGAPVTAVLTSIYLNSVIADMKFSYNKNGTVKEISFSGNDFGSDYTAKSVFTYDSNGKLVKTNKEEYFEYTTWVCEDTYSYSGNQISQINTSFSSGAKNETPNRTYEYITSYSYYGSLVSDIKVIGRSEYGEFNEAEYIYSYDNNRISTFEYKYAGKGQEGLKVYYNYGGKPSKPVNTDPIKLVDTMPKTRLWNNTFVSSLTLTFNHEISNINYEKGNIYIYDKETGTEAYRIEPGQAKTYIRSYQNKLTWVFPGVSSKKALTPGHTYYLKMDASFLSFLNTDKSVSLGNNKDNPEWEFEVRSDEEDIISGDFTFKRTDSGNGSSQFVYDKAYFSSNSSVYNSSLARLSMDVAIAAYNSSDRSNGSEHVTELFNKMKFENVWHNSDYDGPTGDHTTGVCIASKRLTPTKTLIAIAVRGGGYGDEWAGNFILGNSSTDHEGFSNGRNNVINSLKEFIAKYDISGNVVFWVTGYSRGSAIANLTAAYLDDGFNYNGISYGKNNVYAYCFEVPASTTNSAAGSAKYSNIFNIVNPYDLVCRMPLMKWGFTRYGNVMMIPHQYCGSYYNDYSREVLSRFVSLSNHSLDALPKAELINDINKIMGKMGDYIKTRDVYYSEAQDGMAPAIRKRLGNGEIKDSEKPAIVLTAAYLLKKAGGNVIKEGIEAYLTMLLPFVSTADKIKKLAEVYKIASYDYKEFASVVMIPHYAELTLAWMEILEGTNVLEKYEESSSTSDNTRYASLFVKIHCPVNVSVYQKGTDILLARITDDKPEIMENSLVLCWVDETGAKVFSIPQQCDVYFDIVPTDNGQMTIDIISEDTFDGTVLRKTDFENMELVTGQNYRLDVSGGFDGTDYEADLYDYEEDYLFPDKELSENEIVKYDIEVTVEGYGDALSQCDVIEGDTVVLHAVPCNRNKFLGWYNSEGEMVEDKSDMTMTVYDNMRFTARFSEKNPESNPVMLYGGIGIGVVAVIGIAFIVLKKKK
ncbi:MAG: hypothetical protein E7187_00125 [Erysipelotrichaceae bacterium]|nr:hypothetical protein [Erysipelotrichaceae bacterium]